MQAHVFQIDQETKKRWLPSSSAAIRVAYYHDSNRKTFRIIAIENSKVSELQELRVWGMLAVQNSPLFAE